MKELMCTKRFELGNSKNTECRDFSYHFFENLNQKDMENKSFFRSDFRGSHFRNIYFYKNNLDRADFISCTFEDCIFDEVSIGSSEMKNCIFINSHFKLNEYNNTSIQECFLKTALLTMSII